MFGAIAFFASAIFEGGKETDRETNKEDVNEINNEDRKENTIDAKTANEESFKEKIKE